jgi:hypothetical protein
MLAEAGIEVLNFSMTVTPLTSPVEKQPSPPPFFFPAKTCRCMYACMFFGLASKTGPSPLEGFLGWII